MKSVLLLVFLTMSFSVGLYSQKNNEIVGNYRNDNGCRIALNDDSMFYYRCTFSILGHYAYGIWMVSNDTIYLKPVLKDKRPRSIDGFDYLNLSISEDKRSIVYTKSPRAFPLECTQCIPEKFLYRKKKLHEIDEAGRIVVGIVRVSFLKKKDLYCFEKTNEVNIF